MKNTLIGRNKWFYCFLLGIMLVLGRDVVIASPLAYTEQVSFTIKMNQQTLKQILDVVEKQSEFIFVYNKSDINLDKNVNINITNGSIQEVLDIIFRGDNVNYSIKDRQIIVYKEEESPVSLPEKTHFVPQQAITVQGRVTDMFGEPMVGLNIKEKGTSNGTITNMDGEYSLRVTGANAILIFSYIGFETQEVPINGKTTINVQLKEDSELLDEVVVVGYGVQKKVNLSGAVQAVSSEVLSSRPISNVGSGLQGAVPNLNITLSSGRADDAPKLNIRGFTSINDTNGETFILVDNMPVSSTELARINPNDIENISVLKDASAAAIYGARAAFGVVLITTKAAKSDKLQINFSGNYAMRDKGVHPEIVTGDLETVMTLKNAARYPLSLDRFYNEQKLAYGKEIDANPTLDRIIIDPTNPNAWQYYGETNWLDLAHKNFASTYTANIDISKRTDNLSYFISGGYYEQDGLLRYGNDNMKRYNLRSKVDVNLTNWWKLGANLNYIYVDYDSPTYLDGYFYWNINRTHTTDVPFNPDGTWTRAGAETVGALAEGGRRKDRTNEIQASFNTQFDIIKEVWKLNADMSIRKTNKGRDQTNFGVEYRDGPGQPLKKSYGERGPNTNVDNVIYNSWENTYMVYNVYTNFTKTFAKKHFFNGLLGYNRELEQRYYYSTSRIGMITSSLPEINLSTGDVSASNTRSELALEGIFGRLNYIYDNRYIFEVNGRYDGSSRFPKGDRYGFFPSASLAWSVINENFFESAAEKLHISNLKFRGSYGALGNQTHTSFYPAIASMESGKGTYIINGTLPMTMNQPGVVSPTLTWEKVRTINFGLDLDLFHKFNLNFDVYTRYTEGMLALSKELPGVFGATPPQTNAADLKTKGWELSLGYRDRIEVKDSPLNWSVKFMISDSQATITKYDNEDFRFGQSGNNYYTGKKIGEIWGFITDGYFQTQEEVDNLNQRDIGTADVGYSFEIGDIKMKDLDGDNKITFGDNTLANPGDRRVIGNTSTRFPYSFELAADWKGFDIRVFFQGVGKRDWYPGSSSIYFWGIYAQPWTNVTKKNLDHWTPDNPNAYFPRVKAYVAEQSYYELGTAQTKYLQNAAYLRMKNLTIGYTIPRTVLDKIHISYLRFYLSAENLFTISKLDKGIGLDPEIIDQYSGFNSGTYPMQRVYSIGANLTF